MKYLKTYEQNTNEPQVGDYVLCEEGEEYNNELFKFIRNNIGQYILNLKEIQNDKSNIHHRWISDCEYIIEYKNAPKKFNEHRYMVNNCRAQNISNIKYWSKNKEDLETILASKKYNI